MAAAFHAARPMEDFFINPTLRMDHRLRSSTMVDDNQLYMAAAAHHDFYMAKSKGKEPVKPSASIVDLVNEPVFWHGYTSEEEVASPVDDDDVMSLHSDVSIYSIASSTSLPEQLAETCSNVQQQCNRAQAVKIQAAGKARVVSLPKPIDIPARRSIMRPASPGTPSKRPSLARLRSTEGFESTRSSEDSRNNRTDSISSSSVNSPASTAPSSVDDSMDRRPPIKHQHSFSRHVPLMEAAKAFSPPNSAGPYSPMFPQSAGLPKRQSTSMSDRSEVSSITTNRSSVRRMTKFSSGFGLNKITKNRVGRESMQGGDLESVKEPEPNYIAPTTQPRIPARTTSMKPKMVARGANERAPPMELAFLDEEPPNNWPLKDTGANSRPRSFSTKLTHVASVR